MRQDSLGDRMKGYENVNRYYLIRRMPVIIRIDGRAFHTFTKHLQKPFDAVLNKSMMATMEHLCRNIQGCVLGYTQSDEISLLLIDYQTLETSAWFDDNVQKMASVSASMATVAFNKYFARYAHEARKKLPEGDAQAYWKYCDALVKAEDDGATFDARVFNLPKEEVTNYFLWRQNDAIRNAIESVGHCNFTTRELHRKRGQDIVDMLANEKGIDFWNDFPTEYQRGACNCKKALTKVPVEGDGNTTEMYCLAENEEEACRMDWVTDISIPIFKGEGREYIEKWLYPNCTDCQYRKGV